MPHIKKVHIMRVGDQISNDGTPVSVTREMIEDLANSYDPSVHEAPVILGHSSDSSAVMSDKIPAYAWLTKVYTVGDDLFTDLDSSDELIEYIEKGFYKKRSLAYYPGSSKLNPHNQLKTPHAGKPVLRHLAMLGGAPPAVKGLKDITFADGSEVMTVESDAVAPTLGFQEEEKSLRDILAENAEGWLVFLLEEGENGFTAGISEFVPKPSKENLWLYDVEEDAFRGQLRDVAGKLYDFEIKLGDQVQRSFKLADMEEKQTPEEVTEETTVVEEPIEEFAETPEQPSDTEEFLEKSRSRVSRPVDEEEEEEISLPDVNQPLRTDAFQEEEVEDVEASPVEGDGAHIHDSQNPEGNHKHDELKISMEIMNKQMEEMQVQLQALQEENLLLSRRNLEMREAELLGFAESLYNSEEGAKLTEAVIKKDQLVKLLSNLDQEPAEKVISFGEGEAEVQKRPVDLLKDMLVNLPVMVSFGEVAKTEEKESTEVVLPSPGQGLVFDEDRMEEFTEIQAYAQKNNIGFGEAYKAVKGAK